MPKHLGSCAVLLIALSAAPRLPAQDALVFDKDAATQDQLIKEKQLVIRQMLADTYRKIRKNDPKYEERAMHCIDRMSTVASLTVTQQDYQEINGLAQALIHDGCDNSVLWHISGETLLLLRQYQAAWPQLMKAGQGYDKNPAAHPMLRIYLCIDVFELLGAMRRGVPQFYAQTIFDSLKPAMVDPVYKDHLRILVWELERAMTPYNTRNFEDVCNSVKNDKRVDPWVRHMLLGRLYLKKLDENRKSGNDAAFAESLKLARENLIRAWELKPEFPDAAADMITVATGGGAPEGQTLRFWFQRAIHAQVDCAPAYAKMRWGLRPRWGGSYEEMLAFGEECAASKRYDTEVPYEYIMVIDDIVDDGGESYESIYNQPGVYERVQEIHDGYLAATTPYRKPDWTMAMKAAVAWQCRRWDDAGRFLKQVPDDFKYFDDVFKFVDGTEDRALGEIKAHNAPFSALTAAAERLEKQGRVDDALAVYQGALNAAETDDMLRVFYKTRLAALRRAKAFAAGEWVDLTVDSDLVGWTQIKGKWAANDDGSISGTSGDHGYELLSDLAVGDRFEITCEIDFDPNFAKEHNAGLYFRDVAGQRNDMFTMFLGRKWFAVVSPNLPKASSEHEAHDAPVQKASNQVHLTVFDGKIWVEINSKTLFAGHTLDSYGGEPDSSLCIGLGGTSGKDRGRFTVKYHNVRVRRLEAPPK